MEADKWKKTHWKDSHGNKTSIQIINFLLKKQPVVSIKIKDLNHIPSVRIEDHRKKTADLSCPIIVVEKAGKFQCILDGHHRRQRAIDENRATILAKVFPGKVFDESW